MADEILRRNLLRAFDAGPEFPDPFLLSRTMAALQRVDAPGMSRRSLRLELQRPTLRSIAALALIVLFVVSTGMFIAINHYAHSVVPATRLHSRTGPLMGTTNVAVIGGWWPFSADDVAAMGGGNSPEQQRYNGEIFISHDGGATWRSVKLPSDSVIDVRWIDSDNIVLVQSMVQIEVTTDGGIHWHAIKSGFPGDGDTPFFLNQSEGWELHHYRTTGSGLPRFELLHTANGGADWTVVTTSVPGVIPRDSGVLLPSVVFVDSDHGFIESSAQLFVTQDGGHSWAPSVFSPAITGMQGLVPIPMMFGRDGLIDIPGSDYTPQTVYRTSDGGLTWTQSRSAPGFSIAPLNINTWWSVDDYGRLFETSDGGINWQQIQAALPYGTALSSVTPLGGGVLWGTTSLGPVRSTDGGKHWSIVLLPRP